MAVALFDLDGTLVDSLPELTEAANRTAEHFGLEPSPSEIVRRRIGHGARALVERTVGALAPVDEAMKVFFEAYAGALSKTAIFPGVSSMLDRLGERRVACGIATNKPAAFTGPLLEATGLAAQVDAWASGDEARRKPDPAALRLALSRMGRSNDPVVYVGDMPVDVEAARRFGSAVIGVSWGLDPEGLREAAPDAWVTTPEELEKALLSLLKF